MKTLLIDFINPQGSRSFTARLDKINYNVDLIEPFKQNIANKKKADKKPFSLISVFGRWIVVYSANGVDNDDTIMHFIDFRIDIDANPIEELFSANTVNNIKQIQAKYDAVWQDKFDTVELSFAEPYEKVVKGNIFACDDDDIVLAKAKQLGALAMLQKDSDRLTVSLVDEKVKDGDTLIVNAYALIHFSKTEEENSRFGYIKLYNVRDNFNQAEEFLAAIEKIGGKFDRAFFMEKFTREKWN